MYKRQVQHPERRIELGQHAGVAQLEAFLLAAGTGRQGQGHGPGGVGSVPAAGLQGGTGLAHRAAFFVLLFGFFHVVTGLPGHQATFGIQGQAGGVQVAFHHVLFGFQTEMCIRDRAVDHSRMSVENRELRRQLSEAAAGPEILGRSPAVSAMREIIATVAPTEATVLITGESGTGKELVARAVHGASARANKPLVTVNCAALAENLLESELFGHERGAFTGADRRREGRFLQADGGTLFLDEIGEMPLSLQAKLLRALQQGEVQRVGSDLSLIHI